jgi:hypothetical protein
MAEFKMKQVFVFAVLLGLAFAPAAHSAPRAVGALPSVTQDIVSAGRLRLQSQRLAKLWMQIGLGVNPGMAGLQLSKGLTQFDQGLADLERYAAKDSTQKSMARLSSLWLEYRAALALPYNMNNLKLISYLSEDLMLVTGKLTMKIEEESDGGAGRLLDLSLRQNMLAQRLARLYLMAQAGDKSAGRLVDIEQTRREFSSALDELSNAKENTTASREALELARMQWLFFDRAISDMSQGASSKSTHVATTSERILEILDAVSVEYAQEKSVTSRQGATRRSAANLRVLNYS